LICRILSFVRLRIPLTLFFCNLSAFLFWNLCTALFRNLGALLLGNIGTVQLWNFGALLFWFSCTLRLRDRDALLSRHWFTLLDRYSGAGLPWLQGASGHWEVHTCLLGLCGAQCFGDVETLLTSNWLTHLFRNLSLCDCAVCVIVGEANILDIILANRLCYCQALLLGHWATLAASLGYTVFSNGRAWYWDTFSFRGCGALLNWDLDAFCRRYRFAALFGGLVANLFLCFFAIVRIARLGHIVADIFIHSGALLLVNLLAFFLVFFNTCGLIVGEALINNRNIHSDFALFLYNILALNLINISTELLVLACTCLRCNVFTWLICVSVAADIIDSVILRPALLLLCFDAGLFICCHTLSLLVFITFPVLTSLALILRDLDTHLLVQRLTLLVLQVYALLPIFCSAQSLTGFHTMVLVAWVAHLLTHRFTGVLIVCLTLLFIGCFAFVLIDCFALRNIHWDLLVGWGGLGLDHWGNIWGLDHWGNIWGFDHWGNIWGLLCLEYMSRAMVFMVLLMGV